MVCLITQHNTLIYIKPTSLEPIKPMFILIMVAWFLNGINMGIKSETLIFAFINNIKQELFFRCNSHSFPWSWRFYHSFHGGSKAWHAFTDQLCSIRYFRYLERNIGKRRSTPTPSLTLRTVKVAVALVPLALITSPLKLWIRSCYLQWSRS